MAYGYAMNALGDPTRRAIVELLRGGPRAVGEIARELPVSRPAVSQHLRVLKAARLVSERREGTRRIYRLDQDGLADLRTYFEGFWTQALADFKAAAESERGGRMSTKETDTAIRRTITVDCQVEQAFELFTGGIGTWWPLETHSVAAQEGKKAETAIVEGRVGGRVYERIAGGGEANWAEVLAWEPPHRLVLAWKVNPKMPAPTEIEVHFTGEGERTRVDLVHNGWERLGEAAEEARASYEGGWPTVLGRFEQAAND